jgi:hypothetical protein
MGECKGGLLLLTKQTGGSWTEIELHQSQVPHTPVTSGYPRPQNAPFDADLKKLPTLHAPRGGSVAGGGGQAQLAAVPAVFGDGAQKLVRARPRRHRCATRAAPAESRRREVRPLHLHSSRCQCGGSRGFTCSLWLWREHRNMPVYAVCVCMLSTLHFAQLAESSRVCGVPTRSLRAMSVVFALWQTPPARTAAPKFPAERRPVDAGRLRVCRRRRATS